MMIAAFAGLHRQQHLDMQKVVIMLRTGSFIVVRHNVDTLRTWSGAFDAGVNGLDGWHAGSLGVRRIWISWRHFYIYVYVP